MFTLLLCLLSIRCIYLTKRLRGKLVNGSGKMSREDRKIAGGGGEKGELPGRKGCTGEPKRAE